MSDGAPPRKGEIVAGLKEDGSWEIPLNSYGKRFSTFKLFRERMQRAGKYKEFHQAIKDHADLTKKTYQASSHFVMRKFGHTGAQDEYKAYWEWAAGHASNLIETVHQRATRVAQATFREKRKIVSEADKELAIQLAIDSLPDEAPVEKERAWIRAHPAMVRLARSKDPTKTIIITIDDILNCKHGPAPSKAAYISLQYWSNHAGEFFKTDIKRTDTAGPADPSVIDEEVTGPYSDPRENTLEALKALGIASKQAVQGESQSG